jgi:3'-5' exoribonuclease Rv2179c-like domain
VDGGDCVFADVDQVFGEGAELYEISGWFHRTSQSASAVIGHPAGEDATLMTTHVMIDLETWGTLPGSALRSIGAVTFSPYGVPHQEEEFYSNIDRASCEAAGLRVDGNTEAWWTRQSEHAQKRLLENCRSLTVVVDAFANWWDGVNGTYVWSNGANFDEVLWRVAVNHVDSDGVPWKYWNVRDTRTCWHLARVNPKTIPFQGVQHDAIADARHQAKCVTKAYEILGIKPGES